MKTIAAIALVSATITAGVAMASDRLSAPAPVQAPVARTAWVDPAPAVREKAPAPVAAAAPARRVRVVLESPYASVN